MNNVEAKDYDLYMLESNFGEDEIQERIREKQENGEFCYEINAMKRHLSHEKASEFLLENMGKNSEYVFLHQHQSKEKTKEWDYADT